MWAQTDLAGSLIMYVYKAEKKQVFHEQSYGKLDCLGREIQTAPVFDGNNIE